MIALFLVSLHEGDQLIERVNVLGPRSDADAVAEAFRLGHLFTRPAGTECTSAVVQVELVRPLSEAVEAWLASLSRNELEAVARQADVTGDRALSLAAVHEDARRETEAAVDHFGVEVDEPSIADELEAEFGGVFGDAGVA